MGELVASARVRTATSPAGPFVTELGPEEPNRDPDDAAEFVVQLGAALIGASSPVTAVHERIDELSRAYDLQLDTFVLPTGVWAVGFERRAVVSLASTKPGTYRFDQTKALYDLIDDAIGGGVPPEVGLRRLADITTARPRFGGAWPIAGLTMVAAGIALVIEATPSDVATATMLGLVVGICRLLAVGRPAFETVLPAVVAFIVGGAVLWLYGRGWVDEPLQVLTPALVIFLPGAMLTIGAIELASGSLSSGSGRMVSGAFTLLLLTFGLVVAGSAVGLTTADSIPDPRAVGLGLWAPVLGVAVYVIGVGITFSVPRGAWVALAIVSYIAWASQAVAFPHVGGYVSALIGAMFGVVVALLVDRHLDGPPALLSFTPAFWLLVPGGVSLIGVARATTGSTGAPEISAALFTITGIALGVVMGAGVDRTLRNRFGW